jgi:hypothetical protein
MIEIITSDRSMYDSLQFLRIISVFVKATAFYATILI